VGWLKRRIILAAIAVVLAFAGTIGVTAYVKATVAADVRGMDPVAVLAATAAIPAGTSAGDAARQGLLAPADYPARSLPAGYVRALSLAQRSMVTAIALHPGEILTGPLLVRSARADSGLVPPAGKMVITLQFCLDEAVAGFVRAGSQIAVFGTTGHGNPGSTCGERGHLPGAVTHLMMNRVLVLAAAPSRRIEPAGQPPSSQQPGPQTVILLTVAVTPAQAAKLIALTEDGQPYLALAAPGARIAATSKDGQ